MDKAQWPRLRLNRRLLNFARMWACRRVKEKYKLAGCKFLSHFWGELMRADHPHIGIIVVKVLQHLRDVAADVVVAS